MIAPRMPPPPIITTVPPSIPRPPTLRAPPPSRASPAEVAAAPDKPSNPPITVPMAGAARPAVTESAIAAAIVIDTL